MNEWERKLLDEVAAEEQWERQEQRQEQRAQNFDRRAMVFPVLWVVGLIVALFSPFILAAFTSADGASVDGASADGASAAPIAFDTRASTLLKINDSSGNTLLTIVDNGGTNVESVHFPVLTEGQCYTTWIPAVGSRCAVGTIDPSSIYNCYIRLGTPSVMNATRCCMGQKCPEVTASVSIR